MRKLSPAFLNLAAILFLSVCCACQSGLNAGLQTTAAPDAAAVTVNISPDAATLAASDSEQFRAFVKNSPNSAVTWSASKGTISSAGLYQAPQVTSNTTATVTATSQVDRTKFDNATITITASAQNPVNITTTSLPGATSGSAYSATLTATGGKTPYSWKLTSGALPAGLTLKSSGSISGTTTTTGSFSLTIQVTDSSATKQTDSNPFTLTVSSTGGGGGGGKAIVESFFGADFNGSRVWPPTDGQGQIAILGGIRLWDDGVKWAQLNTAAGSYSWQPLDNWISNAQAQHVDVLYTIGNTPSFAGSVPPGSPCGPSGSSSCSSPKDINSDGTGTDANFSAFITALVTRYKGEIAFYELWNEPDCTCFWSGTTAQIVRMGKDAAAIIRSIDPAARILSPSAHGPSMATWFDGYVAAGGAANFDIVNAHLRGVADGNAIPESFLTMYADVTAETKKRNLTSLPVWDDEHGIKQNQLTDPDMLEGFTARELILRASVGLQRQYEYTWDSSSPYGLQGSLSGTAWDQVAAWLIGHTISACAVSGTVYTCALDNGQIVWDTKQSCSKGTCTTSNYTFPAGYAWQTDLTGVKKALSGKTVPIGYKPILLQKQ
jgi:hypothetical protein